MSEIKVLDYTPRISVESSYAIHRFRVSDVLAFAEILRAAVDQHGLDPLAAIEFHRSSSDHIVRMSAKSGGEGTRRDVAEDES